MAALSASSGPGVLTAVAAATTHHRAPATPPPGQSIDGDSPYYTAMPPLNSPVPETGPSSTPPPGIGSAPGTGSGTGGATGSADGLPATMLAAYQHAQTLIAGTDAGCHLPWELLAAIGQVESSQARGGQVDSNGTTLHRILGPVLNGNGFADITDTDNGRWDGDPVHDRAVGPMQFIPSTWATWGADGNADGVKDPNNVYDAALAAGHYLCAEGRDLARPADMADAILGYNHSDAYLNTVLSWYHHFRSDGVVSVPDGTGSSGSSGSGSSGSSGSGGSGSGGSGSGGGSGSDKGSGSGTSGGTSGGKGSAGPSPSHSAKPSPSADPSASTLPNPGHTGTPRPTASGSASPTGTGTPSPTGTGSPTPTPTGSGCPTGTDSPLPTPTGTATPTPVPSPSGSGDPCATDDPDATGTPSPSVSATDHGA
jgi:hypothetical protein